MNNNFSFKSEAICHWSRVTKKSLFTVKNVLSYFSTLFLSWIYSSAKQHYRSLISPLSVRTIFSAIAVWRHHCLRGNSTGAIVYTENLASIVKCTESVPRVHDLVGKILAGSDCLLIRCTAWDMMLCDISDRTSTISFILAVWFNNCANQILLFRVPVIYLYLYVS